MKIIMINAMKRAGKDHTARLLKSKLPNSEIYAFADPIKEIASKSLQMTVRTFDEYKNSDTDLLIAHEDGDTSHVSSFREFIQNLGSDAMKSVFGKTVWTDLLIRKIKEDAPEYCIISDFRFFTEYEEIEKFAMYYEDELISLKIRNDNVTNNDSHVSENELNDFTFDYEVDNTDHSKLEENLDGFIHEYLR